MYLHRGIDTQRISLFNLQNLKELRSSEEEEESQEDIATYVCDPMKNYAPHQVLSNGDECLCLL